MNSKQIMYSISKKAHSHYGFKNKEQVSLKDKEFNEVYFFWTKKNVIAKPIESYKPRERCQVDIVLIYLYEINLKISLQWWIISQSIDG